MCVCLWTADSPQTSAAGRGPGNGRGCWRRGAAWAAAFLKTLSAGAGAAGSPLFASRRLSSSLSLYRSPVVRGSNIDADLWPQTEQPYRPLTVA